MVDGTLEFRILGPFEVFRDGELVRLGGPRQRAVLARLVVAGGRLVPTDGLIDDVWDGRAPPTAGKTLQKYVSEVRKALAVDGVLMTAGNGYRIAGIDVDADRYQSLVTQSAAAHAADDPQSALELAAAADALWRGPPFADLGDPAFVVAERTRLEELRLAATETRFAAELDLGLHASAVAGLADLTEAHPLRERLWTLFLRALYGSGRLPDALRAYERYRRLLAEELGLEPSPELRDLEGAMLRHELAPAPITAPAAPALGNLPSSITSFVGRGSFLDAVTSASADHRLLTLTGPGGVGKTRLAVEVARRRADEQPGGVWLVDLVPANDDASVVRAVSSALALEEQQGRDPVEDVIAVLRHRKPTLLVLDNCEHVVPGCAALAAAVLARCPDARLVATSRRPLGVSGECVRAVPPLTEEEAVELFRQRADLAPAGFALTDDNRSSVTHICRQLDGLPLAIELAASQTRVLDPAEIASRLDDRFGILAQPGSASPRQRTLLATVEWSYGLLSPPAQRVFARLAAFPGSFTLEAAEAVCTGHGIADREVLGLVTELVDHSMLVRDDGPPSVARYRLLDTLALYARTLLADSGDEADACRAHASFVLRLARAADPHLYRAGEEVWLARLQAEDHNIWRALDWAIDHDRVLAHRLLVALWHYWGLRWLEAAVLARVDCFVAEDDPAVPPSLRAWSLAVVAELAANPGDGRTATTWAEAAVAMLDRQHDPAGRVAAQFALATALGNRGDLDRAGVVAEAGVATARQLDDERILAKGLELLGYIATRRGDLAEASHHYDDALAVWHRIGSIRGCATVYRRVGAIARDAGQLDAAEKLCLDALTCVETLGDTAALTHVRLTLADIARLRGDRDEAMRLYAELLEELRSIGDRRCIASTYKNIALMALDGDDVRRADGLLVEGMRLRHELGDDPGLAECLDGLAAVALADDDVDRATTLLAAAEGLRLASHAEPTMTDRDGIAARVEQARTRSRAGDFAAAWDLGLTLSADEAVAYASRSAVS